MLIRCLGGVVRLVIARPDALLMFELQRRAEVILELAGRMFQHPATVTDLVISILFLLNGLLRL